MILLQISDSIKLKEEDVSVWIDTSFVPVEYVVGAPHLGHA